MYGSWKKTWKTRSIKKLPARERAESEKKRCDGGDGGDGCE